MEPINLTELRADTEAIPPGCDALYQIHRDDLLALIDIAEAARAVALSAHDKNLLRHELTYLNKALARTTL